MQHEDYEVDLYDETGEPIGRKPRRDINKQRDIYRAAFIVLITPHRQIVVTPLPVRHHLPYLYEGLYGVPVATICRSGEDPASAAHRATARELHIENASLQPVGESFEVLDDDRRLYMHVFSFVREPPTVYSLEDVGAFIPLSPHELATQLRANPQQFTPTLRRIWERWPAQLQL